MCDPPAAFLLTEGLWGGRSSHLVSRRH